VIERWLPVTGAEGGYSVSDHGRVRSEARVVIRRNGSPCSVKAKILRQSLTDKGYPYVGIRELGGRVLVHVLLLDAFVGSCPPRQERLHADDVKTNNHLSNLRYGTRSENLRDRVRNGLDHNARKTICRNGHKYTPENTYAYRGERICKTCRREWLYAWRKRNNQREAVA
jgi:hypothetical protein